MKTKKELLAALSRAETVCATMVGGLSLDEWPALVAQRTAEGWTHVHGRRIELGPRFVLRPAINRVRHGAFRATGAKYTFEWLEDGLMRDSHGSTANLQVAGDALELTMMNGAIMRYTVDIPEELK